MPGWIDRKLQSRTWALSWAWRRFENSIGFQKSSDPVLSAHGAVSLLFTANAWHVEIGSDKISYFLEIEGNIDAQLAINPSLSPPGIDKTTQASCIHRSPQASHDY